MKQYYYSPKGFEVTGIHCGLKKNGGKDLAVISSAFPCQVAAIFTTNKVKAAPVLHDQEVLASKKSVHNVIINSGNANACTGQQGMEDVLLTTKAVNQHLSSNPGEVMVLSTGVIGVPLPVKNIIEGIERAASQINEGTWQDAAEAIMTTDTRPKIASIESPEGYIITGIAKGSGMISPNMATMLSVICTDAALSDEVLQKVYEIWNESFNRIVVDGDMSTNDTVMLLANGASGVEADLDSDFLEQFQQICTQLAKSIVSDGEGATKLVTVKISGAETQEDAEKIARAIATSPLCKTAFYGADPNWGRIICAAGYSEANFIPEKTKLNLTDSESSIQLFADGQSAPYNEANAIALMQKDEWEISLDLGLGKAEYWLWTCDLSHEYVTINGHYRT